MANRVLDRTNLDRVVEAAVQWDDFAVENERLGKLSDGTAQALRDTGVMRMLQPRDFGGDAAHPRDFAETVMNIGGHCGSTAWVCGVVGVHPWEMALMGRELQEEVWGSEPDTWIGSPYAPQGIATPTDGGYILNGRWNFGSGADHVAWHFLGAVIGDGTGRPAEPPKVIHLVIPASDRMIVEESWDVFGLKGTGSKDLIVAGVFVPAERTIEFDALMAGGQAFAEKAGRSETLYRMPFWTMFPMGISAATIGMCEGALAATWATQERRVTTHGQRIKDDPYVLAAVSEAAADIAASRTHLLDSIERTFDKVDSGQTLTLEERAELRRNQVRSARRAVGALDEIFSHAGGNVIRNDNVILRFWRDAHAGLQHTIHVPGYINHASALVRLGVEPEGVLRRVAMF